MTIDFYACLWYTYYSNKKGLDENEKNKLVYVVGTDFFTI